MATPRTPKKPPTRATRVAKNVVPPPALSPLDVTPADKRVYRVLDRMATYDAGSPEYEQQADEVRTLTLKLLTDRITNDRTDRFRWPAGLFIPVDADSTQYGIWFGTPRRYDRDFTMGTVGWGAASKLDGSVHAVASSPTAGGEIHGSIEAGVGVLWSATHSLSRLRIQPDVDLIARTQWAVNPKGQTNVWISTRVVGTVVVRGLLVNPIDGSLEPVSTSPASSYQVFDDGHYVSNGASAPDTTAYRRDGAQIPGTVLVEAGRTYLLAVSVQVAIDVHNEDSAGRPVRVTNGDYNTFGTLTGFVPQIWVDETVLIP